MVRGTPANLSSLPFARGTRAIPVPLLSAWWTCLYLQFFFSVCFKGGIEVRELTLVLLPLPDERVCICRSFFTVCFSPCFKGGLEVPRLSLFPFSLSKRIDMKGLNIYIYQRHNKTSISQRFGIYIFTVFTNKLKSPVPQKCWDIRINGIYKSKIWKNQKE